MGGALPTELERLDMALDAAERDARAIVEGLSETLGGWRPQPSSWSVAECLDHLATANRIYVRAMQPAAANAQAHGRIRRRPAQPGLIGGWFVKSLEPPVRLKTTAPRAIRPRSAPPLTEAISLFLEAQDEVRNFLRTYSDIDLNGVRFPNPFIPGVRFSLATGLHVIPAHERRHLWQARRIREAAFSALSTPH